MPAATAKQFLTLLQRGEALSAASLLHDKVVWHQPGTVPISGEYRGKNAVVTLLASFAKLGIGLELLESYRCDDRALCRIIIHHEVGSRKEFQMIGIESGQISSVHHYGDTDYLAQIFHAFGAKPHTQEDISYD